MIDEHKNLSLEEQRCETGYSYWVHDPKEKKTKIFKLVKSRRYFKTP
jgi:hypothetical protein